MLDFDVSGPLVHSVFALVVVGLAIRGSFALQREEGGRAIATLVSIGGGLVLGAALGGLIGSTYSDGDTLGGLPILLGMVLGCPIGALLGGLIGRATAKREGLARPITTVVAGLPLVAGLILVIWTVA